MHTFRDNAGRTWTVAINVTAIKRVRGMLGIDLFTLIDDGFKPLNKLLSDPVQLADVLYCLCKDEADARQITDEEFGRGLAGDAILMAAEAFMAELADFFPEARMRACLRNVLNAGRIAKDKLIDYLEKLIEQIDPEREARTLIASYGKSPASSDSIRAPSPSEN